MVVNEVFLVCLDREVIEVALLINRDLLPNGQRLDLITTQVSSIQQPLLLGFDLLRLLVKLFLYLFEFLTLVVLLLLLELGLHLVKLCVQVGLLVLVDQLFVLQTLQLAQGFFVGHQGLNV